MVKTDLTWRDIFNSGHKHYDYFIHAKNEANNTGYRFLSWNGRIYTADGIDTGLLVEALGSLPERKYGGIWQV